MLIENRPIEKLIPYAMNPRKNNASVDLVASSIKEFGFRQPIVVDEDGVIIVGHTRMKAAQKLGMDSVPVHVAKGFSDSQKRAYRIMDNRSGDSSEWDDELLSLELSDLKMDGFDLDLTGFDESNIMGDEEREDDTEPQDDRAEELRDKWGVETGQLWELGDHRLLCGDSTNADDVALCLDGAVPLLMVTDPPYGVKYDPAWRNNAFRSAGSPISGSAVGKVENDDNADWREAYALFPGDVAYVWHAPGALQVKFFDSLVASGFDIRMQIIWAKSQLVIGRGHYHLQHEPCLYAVRKGKTAHWAGDRKQVTLWQIDKPRKSETGHSTQKPLECMARPIRNHESEYVYEPFSGSGTTIIACENLNRRCLAIEISPGYVAVALQRWADHTGREPRCTDGR